MVCCLMAPSQYLNQCWLIITNIHWCSSEGNFAWDITVIYISHENLLEIYFSKILLKSHRGQWVNSSPPSAAYMRQWTESSLVRVMACHLFGAKPLPEPMLVYCQLDYWEQVSVKFESEFHHFHPTRSQLMKGDVRQNKNVVSHLWNENSFQQRQITSLTGLHQLHICLSGRRTRKIHTSHHRTQ